MLRPFGKSSDRSSGLASDETAPLSIRGSARLRPARSEASRIALSDAPFFDEEVVDPPPLEEDPPSGVGPEDPPPLEEDLGTAYHNPNNTPRIQQELWLIFLWTLDNLALTHWNTHEHHQPPGLSLTPGLNTAPRPCCLCD